MTPQAAMQSTITEIENLRTPSIGPSRKPYEPSVEALLRWLPPVEGVHLLSCKIAKRLNHARHYSFTKRGSVERNEVAAVHRRNRKVVAK